MTFNKNNNNNNNNNNQDNGNTIKHGTFTKEERAEKIHDSAQPRITSLSSPHDNDESDDD